MRLPRQVYRCPPLSIIMCSAHSRIIPSYLSILSISNIKESKLSGDGRSGRLVSSSNVKILSAVLDLDRKGGQVASKQPGCCNRVDKPKERRWWAMVSGQSGCSLMLPCCCVLLQLKLKLQVRLLPS